MVEVFDGDEHFLLNPRIEVEGRWGWCKSTIESKGYELPTPNQLLAMHHLLDDINDMIVAHYGSTLKTTVKYWSSNRTEDNSVDIVFIHNGFRQDYYGSGTFFARGVVSL